MPQLPHTGFGPPTLDRRWALWISLVVLVVVGAPRNDDTASTAASTSLPAPLTLQPAPVTSDASRARLASGDSLNGGHRRRRGVEWHSRRHRSPLRIVHGPAESRRPELGYHRLLGHPPPGEGLRPADRRLGVVGGRPGCEGDAADRSGGGVLHSLAARPASTSSDGTLGGTGGDTRIDCVTERTHSRIWSWIPESPEEIAASTAVRWQELGATVPRAPGRRLPPSAPTSRRMIWRRCGSLGEEQITRRSAVRTVPARCGRRRTLFPSWCGR